MVKYRIKQIILSVTGIACLVVAAVVIWQHSNAPDTDYQRAVLVRCSGTIGMILEAGESVTFDELLRPCSELGASLSDHQFTVIRDRSENRNEPFGVIVFFNESHGQKVVIMDLNNHYAFEVNAKERKDIPWQDAEGFIAINNLPRAWLVWTK